MMPGVISKTSFDPVDGKPGLRHDRLPAQFPHFWRVVSLYFLLTCVGILIVYLPTAKDYVGKDNDDVMRLVEVRDLLAGQGWFDLMQYRLGLPGGTLMHWSRLVDLPIAVLISFFSLFLATESAEMMALAVWPLSLLFPLLAAAGIAGRNMGGQATVHLCLGMTALFAYSSNRFLPGSIDHHNVQFVLALTVAAMLVDPAYRVSRFAIAGAACAVAIAIGAETIPLIAAACLCVSLVWAIEGKRFARAAQAFGLALTLTISALFVLTVPPSAYSVVTCDSLSLGFYGLATLGGTLLFLAATVASRMSRLLRSLVLIVIGIAVAAAAVVLAPQCIGSPLANLDPLLRTMWLDNVTEARSIFKEMYYAPGTLGVFYACGLLAIVTCVYQIVRRQNAQRYAILLAMIGISWGVALVQIRGAALANLLSIVPLASMVAQLRARSMAVKTQTVSSFAYVALFLVSMPIGWVLIGDAVNAARALLPGAAINAEAAPAEVSDDVSCTKKADFAQISGLQPSIVATSVDVGAGLLRYTHHRTLSAPYHRNQGGMLAEIHIATSAPDEAEAFMRRAHVSIIALCPSDTGTKNLMRVAPDGFYAQLAGGRVPSFLEALPKDPSSGFILFRLKENGV